MLRALAALWLAGLGVTTALFVVVVLGQSVRQSVRRARRVLAPVPVRLPAQTAAPEQVPLEQRAIA